MSPQSDLPDLFGRATLVLGGHEGLHGTVQGLRITCAAVRAGDLAAAEGLKGRADSLCERVLIHFAAEEGADYFGTISTESLELSEAIARLRDEHGDLSRAIARLRDFRDAESVRDAFVEALEAFLDQLMAHERHETTLLFAFFRPERGGSRT